jgi:hypothetical protein
MTNMLFAGTRVVALGIWVFASMTFPASAASPSLKGVCPDPVIIQLDWLPQAETGYLYQLIGPNGTVKAGNGIYSGPLRDTGVTLELRSGGPFLGNQQMSAILYQDHDILLGALESPTEQVRTSLRLRTIAVYAPLNKLPNILMYDPSRYQFSSLADVGKSQARVLYFEGAPYMDFLVSKGLIRKEQLDPSYDGSPSRFIAERGAAVQQGFVTSEPYRYQHDIKQWSKPVSYLLVADAGFNPYKSALAGRPEAVTRYEKCLAQLVPLMQRAQAEYMASPSTINDLIIKLAEAYKAPGRMTSGLLEYAVSTMRKLGIVTSGGGSALGSFDMNRVQEHIGVLTAQYKARGVPVADDLKAGELVTNRFIDPRIGL